MLAEHGRHRRGFERRLNDVWGVALGHYFATYVACVEAGEWCNDVARPGAVEEQDICFEALTRLHGRACLVASEIYALLRTGHTAGAEAHWRTLHELSVVAGVLAHADQEVAERYLLHSMIAAAKDIREYERVRDRLESEAIDPTEVQKIEAARTELRNRYGKEYDSDWGWAIPLVGRNNVSFRDLEEMAKLDHRRPYYRLGSHRIHAGARGLDFGTVEFREMIQ